MKVKAMSCGCYFGCACFCRDCGKARDRSVRDCDSQYCESLKAAFSEWKAENPAPPYKEFNHRQDWRDCGWMDDGGPAYKAWTSSIFKARERLRVAAIVGVLLAWSEKYQSIALGASDGLGLGRDPAPGLVPATRGNHIERSIELRVLAEKAVNFSALALVAKASVISHDVAVDIANVLGCKVEPITDWD